MAADRVTLEHPVHGELEVGKDQVDRFEAGGWVKPAKRAASKDGPGKDDKAGAEGDGK